MLPHLLPIINAQSSEVRFVSLYTGGGALEFSKDKHTIEIWNDNLYPLTVFYECLKDEHLCRRLKRKINATLFSESNYLQAKKFYKRYLYNCKGRQNKINLAWAVYLMCNMTYASGILKGFGFSRVKDSTQAFKRKVVRFKLNKWKYINRLKDVCVFSRDAIEVIKLYKNTPNTLFYADPPYYNSDKGHYGDFTKRDMLRLLMNLSEIEGKFVLSSYPSDILDKYIIKHNWWHVKIEQQLCLSSNGRTKEKRKVECITCNFDPTKQLTLF